MKGLNPIALAVHIFALSLLATQAYGCNIAEKPAAVIDTTLTTEIQKQLGKGGLSLRYPRSVKRFYEQLQYAPVWIKPQSGEGPAWRAMLTIDCVLQFGLWHPDFHPDELTYAKLHHLLDTPGKARISDAARFEILLTDGIITLINNLHFGKLNPYYAQTTIDRQATAGFDAAAFLTEAIGHEDLLAALALAQPRSKAYASLQEHMRLLAGKFEGDCYDVPEPEMRKLAINMERLRWADVSGERYITVNIPSFSLRYRTPDSTYLFKVIVGKAATPTPTLTSTITYFTTAPDWRVPDKIFIREILPKAINDSTYLESRHYAVYDSGGNYVLADSLKLAEIKRVPAGYYAKQSAGCDNSLGLIVFRFKNQFDVYLHDTPEQQLFNKTERAFSHGCIRVQDARKLAALLLKDDAIEAKISDLNNAIESLKTRNFKLDRPIPIKVTYLTSIVQNGLVVTYRDIYNLDATLETALYQKIK